MMNLPPVSQLSEEEKLIEEELIVRELASRTLEDFITYTMPDFAVEQFHRKLFDALERVERGELKRLMVFMPPRSGKSEVISKRFPAWVLGRNPKKQVIVASYGADLANEFGRKTKQITQMQEYKNVFPEFNLAEDKREGGHWDTKEGGGYYSVGVGGALTGRGGDLMIVDDPVRNREDAESQTYRDKTYDWYTSTFYTRQQGSNAAIIILQTRWNTDDLSGRILEAENDDFEVISFPAIDEEGNALCNREGYGVSFYEAQRDAIGVRDFEALYQQDPIRASGAVFKKQDFRYFNMSDINSDDFTFAVSVDPAWSTNTSSDDVAIAVTARHKVTKDIYVLDVLAEPIAPSDSYAYALTACEMWKSKGWTMDFLSVEDVKLSQHQTMYVAGLMQYFRDNGKIYTVLPFMPQGQGKKQDRIKYTLEPYFNRHAIYFRSDDPGNKTWQKLETQLLKFPNNAHEDILDAVSQGVAMWGTRGEPEVGNTTALREHLERMREKRENEQRMRNNPDRLYKR
jgi:predicted phage terminase large subunit-like protein